MMRVAPFRGLCEETIQSALLWRIPIVQGWLTAKWPYPPLSSPVRLPLRLQAYLYSLLLPFMRQCTYAPPWICVWWKIWEDISSYGAIRPFLLLPPSLRRCRLLLFSSPIITRFDNLRWSLRTNALAYNSILVRAVVYILPYLTYESMFV